MLERRLFEKLHHSNNNLIELVPVRFIISLLQEPQPETKTLDTLWRELCRDGMNDPIIIHANSITKKVILLDGKKRISLFNSEGIVVAPTILLISNNHEHVPGMVHDLCIPGILDSSSTNFELKVKPSEVLTVLNEKKSP